MEKRIVECVPNFSEGRDKAVIRQITSAIESSGGVKLLDVDPGGLSSRSSARPKRSSKPPLRG